MYLRDEMVDPQRRLGDASSRMETLSKMSLRREENNFSQAALQQLPVGGSISQR